MTYHAVVLTILAVLIFAVAFCRGCGDAFEDIES